MFDVLLLLPVSWRFFQSFDDKRGCRRDNGDSCLSVLDGEFDGDTKTFLEKDVRKDRGILLRGAYPITSGFCNVFTNFLGRKSQGTDLWCERRGRSNLTAGSPQMAMSVSWVKTYRLQYIYTYMTFTSLGSNFGAGCENLVSRHVDDTQEDDTYAWRVRKVVSLS